MMSKDENKVQAYVDEKTKAFLCKKSDEKAISTSKYIAQVLAEHAENEVKNNMYKARVLSLLGTILTCVYDQDLVTSNQNAAQEIMDSIKQEARNVFG